MLILLWKWLWDKGEIMAIDFDKVFKTLNEIQTLISQIVPIARLIRDGKVSVDHIGGVYFTSEQKAILASKYTSIKAEVTSLFKTLP